MELQEYLKEIKKEANKIKQENPHWNNDKCLFLAKKNVPKPVNDGWEY